MSEGTCRMQKTISKHFQRLHIVITLYINCVPNSASVTNKIQVKNIQLCIKLFIMNVNGDIDNYHNNK